MKEKQIRDYKKIGITMQRGAIHVQNDQILKETMGAHLSRATELSEYIKEEYEKEYEEQLQITTDSLAVELLGHFLIQEISLKTKKIFAHIPLNGPVMKFCDWLLRHMDVIDCGEKACDNNRFLWDAFSVPVSVSRRAVRGLERQK